MEQAAARKHIEDEWRASPVYTRDLCEKSLKGYPTDSFICTLYGETLGRLALLDEA